MLRSVPTTRPWVVVSWKAESLLFRRKRISACWKGLPCFTFMPVVVTDFWGFRIKPFEDHFIVHGYTGNGNSQSLARACSSTCLEMMMERLMCKVKVNHSQAYVHVLPSKCMNSNICMHATCGHLYNLMIVGNAQPLYSTPAQIHQRDLDKMLWSWGKLWEWFVEWKAGMWWSKKWNLRD